MYICIRNVPLSVCMANHLYLYTDFKKRAFLTPPVFSNAVSKGVGGGQLKLALGRVYDQAVQAELLEESPEVGHMLRP